MQLLPVVTTGMLNVPLFAADLPGVDLFSWYSDWSLGALYAGVGLAGALVTIFSLVGGVVPGTGGKAKIDEDTAELKQLTQRLDELTRAQPVDAAAVQAVQAAVGDLRRNLSSERRYQFAVAGILYCLLGMFFALLLAKDVLQALVIGAGWTGFIGTVGLKSDYAQRKDAKDSLIDDLTDTAEKLEQARNQAVDRLTTLPGLPDDAAARSFVEHIQPVLELSSNGTAGIDLQRGHIDDLQRRATVVKAL